MDLGLQMKDMGISLKDASKEETPKSIKELTEEVLGSNKTTKMFQTMATMSLEMGNLGNLGLEVTSFKTKLTTMERRNRDCWNKSKRGNNDIGVQIMYTNLEQIEEGDET